MRCASIMAARRRQGGGAKSEESNVAWRGGDVGSSKNKRSGHLSSRSGVLDGFLPDVLVLLYLALLFSLGWFSMYMHWRLPEPLAVQDALQESLAASSASHANLFSALRARRHLEDISALGVRHVGSEANEVLAKAILLEKIEEIRRSSSSSVEIEVVVQNVSGGYFLDFLAGMTHIYHNVTNIAVRFSRKGSNPQHAFLINAHYDSAIGSIGASDDACSCSIMLEVLQCLSSDPNPYLSQHALVLLFNGAEETFLQASHGFITQHPWAGQIRAFLNLEAAGAGGREIVFQTGPQHPWLVRAYASAVPHPYASVVAQEIFQSGVIMSDTDFRIFRDYGHIPGIDAAFYVNGYVYHTEHDVPSAIHDGCIQRAGENVVALVKHVASSPLLANPEEEKHGKVVFFDLLGLVTVVYPERLALIINSILVLASLGTVYLATVRSKKLSHGQQSDHLSWSLILGSVAVQLVSWVAAAVAVLLIASLVTATGRSMSWYSTPHMLALLYGLPALLVCSTVQVLWTLRNPDESIEKLEKASSLASQLIWTLILAALTYLRLCSAVVFMISVASVLIFKNLLWEYAARKTFPKARNPELHYIVLVLFSILGIALPFLLALSTFVAVFKMFVPMFGRSGSVTPPDVVVSVLVVFSLWFIGSHIVSFLVLASSARMKRFLGLVSFVFFAVGLVAVLLGLVFPYTGGPQPRPKRMFIQQVDRTYLNLDGSLNESDSVLLLSSLDYLELAPMRNILPASLEIQKLECKGLMCGVPLFIPILQFLKNFWYVPIEEKLPQNLPSTSLEQVSAVLSPSGSKTNFTFEANFPVRANLFIRPSDGYSMTAWSLDSHVPPRTVPCGPKRVGGGGDQLDPGCYFIFYARGFGDGKFSFWLELIKDEAHEGKDGGKQPSLDIAVASHHLDPPHSKTEFLSKEVLEWIPDWVTTVTWTSTYTSYLF